MKIWKEELLKMEWRYGRYEHWSHFLMFYIMHWWLQVLNWFIQGIWWYSMNSRMTLQSSLCDREYWWICGQWKELWFLPTVTGFHRNRWSLKSRIKFSSAHFSDRVVWQSRYGNLHWFQPLEAYNRCTVYSQHYSGLADLTCPMMDTNVCHVIHTTSSILHQYDSQRC